MNNLLKTDSNFKKIIGKAVAVVILVAIQPYLWQSLNTIARDVHAKRSQKQQIGNLKERIIAVEQTLASETELLDQLDAVLPLNNSVPQAIERLERLATERQVELKIIDLQEVAGDAGAVDTPVLPLRVRLEVTGTSAALLSFMEAIEHLQELTTIEAWDMAPAKAGAATPTVAPTSSPSPSASPPPSATLYTLSMTIQFYLQLPDDGQK